MVTSVDDMKSLRFWRAALAEFIGSVLLVLMGCGSCINVKGEQNPSLVQVALGFGFTVASLAWVLGHTSGAHFNPSLTIAMFLTRKVSLARSVFYIIFQTVGSVVGAALLLSISPRDKKANLCPTVLAPEITPMQGIVVEFMMSLFIVLVVFATIDSKRSDHGGSFPLTIGIAIMACILMGASFTGAGISPIRSFGPAAVAGEWSHHWIYWVGPIAGGIVGAVFYDNVLAVNATLLKVKACFLTSDYDGDRFEPQNIKIKILEEKPNLKAPLAEEEQ